MSEIIANPPSWGDRLTNLQATKISQALRALSGEAKMNLALIRAGKNLAVSNSEAIHLPLPVIKAVTKPRSPKHNKHSHIAIKQDERSHINPYEDEMDMHWKIMERVLGFKESQFIIQEERKHAPWSVIEAYLSQPVTGTDRVIFLTSGSKKDGYKFAAYGIYPQKNSPLPVAG